MSNYVLGKTQEELLGNTPRFFYGLKRNNDGEIFLFKIDQLSKEDFIEVNTPGDPIENYAEFSIGEDFFEGRSDDHLLIFKNLNFEQYRWDNRNLYYYINEEGMLVVRINNRYNYPNGLSS